MRAVTAPQPTLSGPRVRLRPWRPDDVEAVTAACQDPALQRWTRVPVPYARTDAEAFVGEVSAAMHRDGGASFAVVTHDDDLVGSMGLFPPRDGVGEVGYWTVAGMRGQGYTAEAVRVLGAWAFDELGLRRLELEVDPRNTASQRVGERAGFVVEGVLRQRSLHRGVPVDDVVLGLLASDPRPPSPVPTGRDGALRRSLDGNGRV
jgi:RimJ/RimL family protein N-acetyltransferase